MFVKTIGGKLIAAFVFVTIIASSPMLFALVASSRVAERVNAMVDSDVPLLSAASEVRFLSEHIISNVQSAIRQDKSIAREREVVTTDLAALRRGIASLLTRSASVDQGAIRSIAERLSTRMDVLSNAVDKALKTHETTLGYSFAIGSHVYDMRTYSLLMKVHFASWVQQLEESIRYDVPFTGNIELAKSDFVLMTNVYQPTDEQLLKLFAQYRKLNEKIFTTISQIDQKTDATEKSLIFEKQRSIAFQQANHTIDQLISYLEPLFLKLDDNENSAIAEMESATKEISDQITDLVRIADDRFNASRTDVAGIQSQSWLLTIIAAVIGLSVAATISLVMSRSIATPLKRLVTIMIGLAKNDTRQKIPDQTRSDEVGAMARSVEVFRQNAIERFRLELEAQKERDREAARQSHIERVVAEFKAGISTLLHQVNNQTIEMRQTSVELSSAASEASQEVDHANRASLVASTNVQAVAAATEELSTAIREIAQQTITASRVTDTATDTAAKTDQQIAALANAANRIGTVVDLIRKIAEQTNLLALNATIEAARAGEAGRGFAIVASEVKALATQTTSATSEISSQVSEIQSLTRSAVEAIRSISGTVATINGITAGIASAIEEQQSVAGEIATSVARASDGVMQSSGNVDEVAKRIANTGNSSVAVNMASEALSGITVELTQCIGKFMQDIVKDVDERRKSLRIRMNEIVVVDVDGHRMRSNLVDMSETGARISPVEGISTGQEVLIELADRHMIKGTVVRRAGSDIGIKFAERQSLDRWMLAAA